jgi:CheY-like chemotaxis protein
MGSAAEALAMKTIFLVEDDPVVVKVYAAKFQREGFRVELAEDGLVAMKKLLQVKADIIVLDLMMPKLNGVDVLKYIRATPELKQTPVIILSNAHMTSLAQEAAAVGAEKALLKSSCTPSQLLEVINSLLSGAPISSDPAKRLAAPAPPPVKPKS